MIISLSLSKKKLNKLPTNKISWQLQNSYASLPELLYSFQDPSPVAKPIEVCFNESLADELGLPFLGQDTKPFVDYFSGNKIPDGSTPIAQAYAGYQFGHFNRLGDGRAILLGEQITPSGNLFDIQLKGAGQTPYSRRGDGRATLYSMLREYLISEAMHHIGIPTTRSLAVVKTGEQVYRETVHEGAVLTRVATSHIRVGTFEYARNFGSLEDLQVLTQYTIQRHYPEIEEAKNPSLELLRAVMYKQIDLIIHWMRVGFIHGVLNTDNVSIAGETIDYGPCAFMNAYDPGTVFSSIDTLGRYAYANQPYITKWNLAIFANALLPIISDNQEDAVRLAQGVLEEFQYDYSKKWYAMMFAKLGILKPEEEDKELVDQLLVLMENNKIDYTQLFLALQLDKELDGSLFKLDTFKAWKDQWNTACMRTGRKEERLAVMNRTNPKVIPRNHWVENALEAAVQGNMEPFNELLGMLSKPYENHCEEFIFQQVPNDFDEQYQTFCGT